MAGFNNQPGCSSPTKGLHQSSSSNSIKTASAGASMGPSKTVMYKRRRASRRVPTTILETSCQEFRDAVQKLTGFHRPSKQSLPTKPRPVAMASSSYELDEPEAAEGPSPGGEPPVAESVEYFHQFLRESSSSGGSPQSSAGHESPPAAATSRGAPCPPPTAPFAVAMRAAAYQQQQQGQGNAAAAAAAAMFGHGGGMPPPFWENFPFGNDAFTSSLAKLQDPAMAPNPYLVALENQLLAKFARRMQQAATAANPLDHPWYQMDHMAPLRA